jgi:3-hydroxyisobutyrate dehydrogenase
MLKDLRLAMEAAAQSGATVPMGALAEKLYAAWVESDHGAVDFSGIIKTL